MLGNNWVTIWENGEYTSLFVERLTFFVIVSSFMIAFFVI